VPSWEAHLILWSNSLFHPATHKVENFGLEFIGDPVLVPILTHISIFMPDIPARFIIDWIDLKKGYHRIETLVKPDFADVSGCEGQPVVPGIPVFSQGL
jgi:hypothetical protein